MKSIFNTANKWLTLVAVALATSLSTSLANAGPSSSSEPSTEEYLVKFSNNANFSALGLQSALERDSQIEVLSDQWALVKVPARSAIRTMNWMMSDPSIAYVQPNYKLRVPETYQVSDALRRAALMRAFSKGVFAAPPPPPPDNPAIPAPFSPTIPGTDPLFSNQWGLLKTKTDEAWKFVLPTATEIVVAVIDTGVDYTHEDLAGNLWRNSKEIPGNKIDDDHNGYIDDEIGWDFFSNDNKPYDFTLGLKEILFGGGNPGHGTHCAGTIGAGVRNGLGISGMSAKVKIMPLRFISERGQGDTAGAIKAIRYAVDNGAQILSNSWGSEGEDPSEAEANLALREAVQYAQDKNVLFVVAAGNSGYDSDSSPNPIYPSSYPHENIISVAATDDQDTMASFSNWGPQSVDVGAPGVAVYSTMVGGKYSQYVTQFGGLDVTWDGTSMAAPHAAGALALYWSNHPQKSWKEVKEALLHTVDPLPSLHGKVLTGGRINVLNLLQHP